LAVLTAKAAGGAPSAHASVQQLMVLRVLTNLAMPNGAPRVEYRQLSDWTETVRRPN
jgi:hypothetical protein